MTLFGKSELILLVKGLEVEPAARLLEVREAHGDPILHGVLAHAPQQLRVHLRHVLQRRVGHGHVDEAAQLVVAIPKVHGA